MCRKKIKKLSDEQLAVTIADALEYGKTIGKKETIKNIIEYVKSDEFLASWVNAKGTGFGDFLAEQLKNNI